MSKHLSILKDLKSKCNNYWGIRITSQLEYAYKLSKVNHCKFHELINETVDFIKSEYDREGTITKSVAIKAEGMMAELAERAKSFRVICAAHAHIDMNWMWGFHETVAVTLDTFRTMLDLMEEYPEFKFSQSQASVYRIVEEYDSSMLEEIKKRVKEGRWEVTASTWVETDKNMPNGESLARHILYTKRYLSRLLDIETENLKIDFEPDTFGHNINVPEILSKGGVKYYYHCRGYEKHNIYIWKSPSGSSVLVYREPDWYNSGIEPSMVLHVPEFCTKHGIDTALKVYGVGDHGGGPTRKDIEKIIDMAKWPVFPEIRFGTFREYFGILEKIRDKLPVEENELNFIFTGCYTTQSRIKMSNRISEAKLHEAECFSSLSAEFAGGNYKNEAFKKAWENVLFNHFHDIIPGSGVIDTREYAMGLFQKTVAIANTEASTALRNIASRIDTSGLFVEEDIRYTTSEGSGVGYGIAEFGLPQAERGRGKNRIFHFFNPSPYERNEVAEITVWDWDGDKSKIVFRDSSGNTVRHQVIGDTKHQPEDSRYWSHKGLRILVDVSVPAYGYSTYTMSEMDPDDVEVDVNSYPRVEHIEKYVLENSCIRAEFDPRNAALVSLVDKKTGREMLDGKRPAGIFRLIEEDDCKGMTAWVIGRYMRIYNLNSEENVKILNASIDSKSLRQWIEYGINFRNSKIKVKVSLDKDSSRLDYDVECDWQERAAIGEFIPQLNFFMPFGYECEKYRYDIPFGTIERQGMDMDVPANSWIFGVPKDNGGKGIMIITQTKYGFRGNANSAALTLIRSSYDPDPYPENCIHNIKFAVNIADQASNYELIRQSFNYNHAIKFLSGTAHEGNLPLQKSFITMESGNAVISAIKMREENSGKAAMIIRAYETEGSRTNAVFHFDRVIGRAYYVDINENAVDTGLNISIDGHKVEFEIDAYSVASVCIEFADN